jgi:hypothetical protein
VVDDPWHFPRTALADRTLTTLVKGPAKALLLFGPRRTGKTTFLTKDLAPAAEKAGHRVVYASFWSAPLSPLAVLLHALETSRRTGTLADRARSMVVALTPKLKLSGPLPGTNVEASVDLTELTGKPRSELLLYLDDLLGRLANPKKPTLLLLDEVQELARSEDNKPLIAALRTSLDKRSTGLATIFTGSSREGLQAMFSSREAPFFHFATPIDLPALDGTFVDHMLKAFHAAAKRKIARAEAVAAFEALHRNPESFRALLDLLMQRPAMPCTDALAELSLRLAADRGYPELWLSLNPLQRACALSLADGMGKPFAEASLKAIGKRADAAQPTRSQVQKALQRMARLGVADQWDGRWTLADPDFGLWIKALPRVRR